MKSFGNLFASICTISNLQLAFQKTKKGKPLTAARCAFEVNLEWELLRLQEELDTGVYQPGLWG